MLEKLRRLAAKDRRSTVASDGIGSYSTLFTFVTRERERIAGSAFSQVSIVATGRVKGSREHGTAATLFGRHGPRAASRLARRCRQ
ncbi:hypothetical protein [Agrobacterium pusense]|nr:hypothetical protein [Agrobacterium pusense]